MSLPRSAIAQSSAELIVFPMKLNVEVTGLRGFSRRSG